MAEMSPAITKEPLRFDAFDIVVVPFPQPDRLAEKRRPALVISNRKLAPFGFTQAEAWRELERLRQLWTMILPSENVLTRAEQLTASHNLSFWDSLLVAACMEGGVTRLYTEDFDASLSSATGIEIINPF